MLGYLKQPSLAVGIFGGVGLAIALMLLAVGFLAYGSTDEEIVEIYDSQMISSATVLWSLARTAPDTRAMALETDSLPLSAGDRHALKTYARWRSYRVWRDGRLIRTANSPFLAGPAFPAGFRDVTRAGVPWRVYTLAVPQDHLTVEVGEKAEARGKLTGHVLRDLLTPLAWGLPLAAFGVWLGIRWGLRPLRAFGREIAARSAGDLSGIAPKSTTLETRPLLNEINSLLERIRQAVDRERVFLDSAAHELRTPLATLNVQTDILTTSDHPGERSQATAEIKKGVKRASRLLDQLLTAARVPHRPVRPETVRLQPLLREAIEDVLDAANAKGIALSVSGPDDVSVVSDAYSLGLILSNLLHNAVKYTPRGGKVSICVAPDSITITDTGPGIAPEDRACVFDRFYRVADQSESGSGLGLFIVRTLAETLDIEVVLAEPDGHAGLAVKLLFRGAVLFG